MTPSFIGLMAMMSPGVRPSISLASLPTASTTPLTLFQRDDRRLVEHDPLAAGVHTRVGGSQVDREVARDRENNDGIFTRIDPL